MKENSNSSISQDQVIEYLSNLPVMHLSDLIKNLEHKWDVKASPVAVPMANIATSPAPVPEEKTEFSVTLTECPADKKIAVIKVVRELASLGLGEAKTFVESIPKVLKDAVSKTEADDLKKKLEEVGAKVEIA